MSEGAVGDALIQAPIQLSCPLASLRFRSPLQPVYSNLPLHWSNVFSQGEERNVSQPCWIKMGKGTKEGMVMGEEEKP